MTNPHGKLKNRATGETISGTKIRDGESFLIVTIDGCRDSNWLNADEWDWTPDPPTLPTKPGLYQIMPSRDSKGHHILTQITWCLGEDGEWSYYSNDRLLTPHEKDMLASAMRDQRLVRLVWSRVLPDEGRF
jgi:hypothetical protein